MARIEWDKDRIYEHGVSHGVLYGQDNFRGVPWRGLVSVAYQRQGGEYKEYFVDGYKFHHETTPSEYSARIEALTYPDEFERYIGGKTSNKGLVYKNQRQRQFHLCYRTERHNEVTGKSDGYQLHLVYNAIVQPFARTYSTDGNIRDNQTLSWDIRTKPIRLGGSYPTAELVIRSWETDPAILKNLEDILYGTDEKNPRMIGFSELITLFDDWPYFAIVPNYRIGIGELKSQSFKDLQGDITSGIYEIPLESRLIETSVPGIFTLEG